jgi:hypothetical protein
MGVMFLKLNSHFVYDTYLMGTDLKYNGPVNSWLIFRWGANFTSIVKY